MTMTNTELSRRAMLTVTAAGVALAGCKPTGSEVTASSSGNPVCAKGINPSFGDDPNKGFPAGVAYSPRYMTLVRVSSKKAWDISTNHASFYTPDDPTKRRELAVEIFKKFKGNNSLKRFSELSIAGIVAREPGKYDAIDFDDFNFGWQHDIYIWFDSTDVALHKIGNDSHLIEMTAFRADGTPTHPNKSFYATDISSKISGDLGGQMILVRNYLRDDAGNPLRGPDGKPVGPPFKFKYSMNIFFELIRKDSQNLVVILDPDTGNGTGYDPLITT